MPPPADSPDALGPSAEDNIVFRSDGLVFFGLAGGVGPGSSWEKLSDGSLVLRAPFANIENLRIPPSSNPSLLQDTMWLYGADTVADLEQMLKSDMLVNGPRASGAGSARWGIGFGASLAANFDERASGLDILINAADEIAVLVDERGIDMLNIDQYLTFVELLPPTSSYRRSMELRDRYFVKAAISVKGITITLESSDAAKLKVAPAVEEMRSQLTMSTSSEAPGVNLSLGWNRGGDLVVASSDELYIGGVLYSNQRFQEHANEKAKRHPIYGIALLVDGSGDQGIQEPMRFVFQPEPEPEPGPE